MRTTPLATDSPTWGNFDSAVRSAAGNILGTHPDDDAWREATWGVSAGGLGIRSPREHAPAAYVASRIDSAAVAQSLAPYTRRWDAEVAGDGHLGQALRQVSDALPEGVRIDTTTTSRKGRQRSLSGAIDVADQAEWRRSAPLAARTRCTSKCAPHAGAWLVATPSPELGNSMTTAEWRAAACAWLGVDRGSGHETTPRAPNESST